MWRSLSTSVISALGELPARGRPPCSLEEFASRSTLHGIHHIFRHRRYTVRNLLWLLAFLGSLALLVHAYAKCVGLYFQYPHSTQLEEETEHNKIFPAVTICNLNPARFSQLSSHDLYWAGEMLGLLDSAGRPLVPESPERSRLEALLGMLAVSEEEKSRPFHLEEFYERVVASGGTFQGTGRARHGPWAGTHSLVHCCGADKEILAPSEPGSGKLKDVRHQFWWAVRLWVCWGWGRAPCRAGVH
uniref:Acid sensing ion channel subunit 1 n=1 Tax=Taeniopygia guttata TaxID=59729 RepID=A0A674GM29_TAEGU